MVAKNLGMVLEGDTILDYVPSRSKVAQGQQGRKLRAPHALFIVYLCHAFVCLHVRFVW